MIDRVDAHHHLWSVEPTVPDWLQGPATAPISRSFTTTDLTDAIEGTGVVATVLVQTVHEVLETEQFLGVAELTPLIAAVTGWVDLTDEGVADELARLREVPGGSHLRAIRHGAQGEPDDGWLARPEVIEGVRVVGAAGLVYELLTIPRQLPAAVQLVRALPEVSFVLDHAGKPLIATDGWQPWADDIAALAALPNVVCKLSGLVTEDTPAWTAAHLARYVDHLLEVFGPARLLFGSDWPVCLLRTDYAGWVDAADTLTAGLSESERAAVFAGNARTLYSL
jgi:L-fuconolactonase